MQCPRDGAPLTTEPYGDNTAVDRCAACGGVWLDLGELENIQDGCSIHAADLDDIDVIANAYEMARQKFAPGIKCPRCALSLEAAEYAYCSRVLVDRCAKCAGVWLDFGELEALERFFKHATRPRERFWQTMLEAQRLWRFSVPGDPTDW